MHFKVTIHFVVMKFIFSVIFGARKFSHPPWKSLNTPLPCIYLVYTFLDQYSNYRSSSNSSAWTYGDITVNECMPTKFKTSIEMMHALALLYHTTVTGNLVKPIIDSNNSVYKS